MHINELCPVINIGHFADKTIDMIMKQKST